MLRIVNKKNISMAVLDIIKTDMLNLLSYQYVFNINIDEYVTDIYSKTNLCGND